MKKIYKRQLPVFIDVYTDWGVPCEHMKQDIFALPKIGEFYNNILFATANARGRTFCVNKRFY
jgi:hypothetical protein